MTMTNTTFKLPSPLHDILIGYMLGDGGIFYASKKSTSPRFEFSMGQERLPFAQHMPELFEEYATNPVKVVDVKASASGPLIKSYRFKSKSLSIFKSYRDLFYMLNPDTQKWVKVVPQNIAELFSPVSLAYLIMADGNYDKARNRVRIYTNSFVKSDVELLAKVIHENFDINAKVMADGSRNNQYIITIGANELSKLRVLVAQHMHPSMKYRVGL